MASTDNPGIAGSLPRYAVPDRPSETEYGIILKELYACHASLIGHSYFYIRVNNEFLSLCRMIYGGGNIYFHEIVNHKQRGISDNDLAEAVNLDPGTMKVPSLHLISPLIEAKLRTTADCLF